MTQVYEINDVAALEELRLVWRSLLGETRMATFFQSLDWLLAYWRHFAGDARLRVLAVESQGRTIGILPLVVRSERSGVGTIRVLDYPLDEWGTFYGPIGPNPAATLAAGLGHIGRTPRDWDLIDLRCVDRNRLDCGRSLAALAAAGLRPLESAWNETMVVDLAGGWDAYWGSRTSHWRSNVRRAEKRLAGDGPLRFVRWRPEGAAAGDDDPRWDLYEDCERVAVASWQGSSETGTTMSHEKVRPFLRDAHISAVRLGAADISVLYVGDRPAAFAYNYCWQGQVFGLRKGFDPQVSTAGAGSVLMARMLRDSAERGDLLLDLGSGSQDCKRGWATDIVPSFRYSHYAAANVRVQALGWKRRLAAWRRQRNDKVAAG